jgi:hypothetical protein
LISIVDLQNDFSGLIDRGLAIAAQEKFTDLAAIPTETFYPEYVSVGRQG